MVRVEENGDRRSLRNYLVEDTTFWEARGRRGEDIKEINFYITFVVSCTSVCNRSFRR